MRTTQSKPYSQDPFHGPPETHHNSEHLTFKEAATGKGKKINCIVSDLVLTQLILEHTRKHSLTPIITNR